MSLYWWSVGGFFVLLFLWDPVSDLRGGGQFSHLMDGAIFALFKKKREKKENNSLKVNFLFDFGLEVYEMLWTFFFFPVSSQPETAIWSRHTIHVYILTFCQLWNNFPTGQRFFPAFSLCSLLASGTVRSVWSPVNNWNSQWSWLSWRLQSPKHHLPCQSFQVK